MKDKDEDLLKSLGTRGTKRILEFLCEHRAAQYHQMIAIMNTYSLNRRLYELIELGLIEHHFEKGRRRKEWYELTEKGTLILQRLRNVVRIVRES